MKTIVLSLGGSIITPEKPDHFFLGEFKSFIIRNLDKYRFIIVCGGGKTNTYYNEAAIRVSHIKKEDLDWIGIMATRLNAEIVRTIFGELAHSKVIHNPESSIKTKKKIIIASGWKPGRSTGYVAVVLAKKHHAEEIINMTNISHVYDKHPHKYKKAKKLYNLTWEDYRKIIGNKWIPRLNSPFDPIASREAQKHRLKVIILKGTDLKNVEKAIENKDFDGTLIN